MPSEHQHIRPVVGGEEKCEVHDWPVEGLAKKLILAMRRAHGRGGITVCRACVERARASLPPRPRE